MKELNNHQMNNDENDDSLKLKYNENDNLQSVSDQNYLSHISRIKSGDVFQIAKSGTLEECILFEKSFGFTIFDQFDLKGQHVLHHAVMNSDQSVFIFIITHGECTTPEEIVSKVSQDQKSVIKIDPCVLSKCTEGSAPIHLTCKSGNLKMTEILLNIGASIEIRDSNLKTPLIVATYTQNIETVIYLISKGANIHAEDKELDNCLHWAAYCGNYELMNLFITFGLDINKPDAFMQTPVHMASMCGDINPVELVLCHSPDLNIKDKKGRTPLQLAVSKNFTETAKKISSHSNRFNKKKVWERLPQMTGLNALRAYIIFSFFYFGYMMVELILTRPPRLLIFFAFNYLIFFIWLTLFILAILYFKRCKSYPRVTVDSDKNEYMAAIKQPFTRLSLLEFLTNNRICHICQIVSDKYTAHCPFTNQCVPNFEEYEFLAHTCVTSRNRRHFLKFYLIMFLYYSMAILFCLNRRKYFSLIIGYVWPFFYYFLRLFIFTFATVKNMRCSDVYLLIANKYLNK